MQTDSHRNDHSNSGTLTGSGHGVQGECVLLLVAASRRSRSAIR